MGAEELGNARGVSLGGTGADLGRVEDGVVLDSGGEVPVVINVDTNASVADGSIDAKAVGISAGGQDVEDVTALVNEVKGEGVGLQNSADVVGSNQTSMVRHAILLHGGVEGELGAVAADPVDLIEGLLAKESKGLTSLDAGVVDDVVDDDTAALVGEVVGDVGSGTDIELLVEIKTEALELEGHAARGLSIDGNDNSESQDDSDLHW